MANRQCPRRLWLQVNQPELTTLSGSALGRIAAGRQLGEVARSLEPKGIPIAADDLRQALDETSACHTTGREGLSR